MKYSLMEHERMRWKTMTDKQLITRLNKTTQMDKLECFARLCYESTDRQYLLSYVERRQREIREGVVKEYLSSARSNQKRKRVIWSDGPTQAVKTPKPKSQEIFDGERYLDF